MNVRSRAETPAPPGEHASEYVPTEAELERSIESVGRAIKSMRRGESQDARESLTALRKELYPDAPPRDYTKP